MAGITKHKKIKEPPGAERHASKLRCERGGTCVPLYSIEYYCLLKMMEALENAGYELIEGKKHRWRVNFQFDKEETGRNIFVFEGHGEEITLFYQPAIWTSGEGRVRALS